MRTEQELLRKKKQIEEAKQELAELQGESKGLEKQLKEDWNCASLREAKTRLQELEDELVRLDEEIAEQCEVLDRLEEEAEDE